MDRRRRKIDSAKGSEEGARRRRERRVFHSPLFLSPRFLFRPPPTLTIPPHVGGVSTEVRGRAVRNRISWEDVIGQEGLGTRFGTEREDGIGGIKIEDDKNGEDDTRKSEKETVIGSESRDERRLCGGECVIEGGSCDEERDRDDRVMIGREEEAAKERSIGKGSEEEESSRRCGQHDGEDLSEIQIALIAVIEGDAPDKFVFGGDVGL